MSSESSKPETDSLRDFIKRLEEWPVDNPPSAAQIQKLKREIHLTPEQRDKLSLLAENHILRARKSLKARAYGQAAAELARAAQLRPRDSRPRTELAGVYLQRSLERGYKRSDRNKALHLARTALELNPGDREARQFLQSYQRMNADFRSARYRRYLVPLLLLLLIPAFLIFRQKEWFLRLLDDRSAAPAEVQPPEAEIFAGHAPRTVPADTTGMSDAHLRLEITKSETGRRNGIPFVDVRGRLTSEKRPLQSAQMRLRGRDSLGGEVFNMPVTIGSSSSLPLKPGDSLPLIIYRQPEADERLISSLELETLDTRFLENTETPEPAAAEVVWQTNRPEGAALKAEVRSLQFTEAYDRQVAALELALTNTGSSSLEDLTVAVSLNPRWPSAVFQAVSPMQPELARNERRAWLLSLNLPLEAENSDRPVTVTVTGQGRESAKRAAPADSPK